MPYADFLDAVAERARLEGAEEARLASVAVLTAVSQYGRPEGRRALADVLPGQLAEVVITSTPRDGADLSRFLDLVASGARTTPERARYLSQAVLSVLAETEPDVARQVRSSLPPELGDLFSAPDGTISPAQAPAAATAADLTQEEVDASLRRLPGWEGDTRRLRRTVVLPPGHDRAVLDRIHRAEEELNHHAVLEEGEDGLVITLWTHSRDRVTELDVRLAERVNDAVEGL